MWAPHTLASEPVSSPDANSLYHRHEHRHVQLPLDSPISTARYNALASIQLQNELNATLPPSPGPVTPRGPVRGPKAFSVPATQESYPGPRHPRRSSAGDRAAQDLRPVTPIRLPGLDNAATPATRHSHREPRPSPFSTDSATGTRPDKDSYPGPFKQLPEFTETLSGNRFPRESHVGRPDDEDTLDGLGITGTSGGTSRTRRSPSQTRTRTPSNTPRAPSHDFSDRDLDLDVDMGDDDLVDDGENDDLVTCNEENIRLAAAFDQTMTDLVAQRAEHAVELEVAQIEIDEHRERRQDAEDRLFELQQQLDDARAEAQAGDLGETTILAERNDIHLAKIALLTEQLFEANERVDETRKQLVEANKRVDSLRARRRSSSHSDGGRSAHDDDLIKTLVDNEKQLRAQIVALQVQHDNEIANFGQQQEGDPVYFEKCIVAMQAKADRLDALWDTLRNFQDMENDADGKNELQARITFLEAIVRKAKAHINDTGEDVEDDIEDNVEDVEDDVKDDEAVEIEDAEHRCQDEVVRLNGEIKDINVQLQDALDRAAAAQDMASAGNPDEIAQNKIQIAYLTSNINSLNREIDILRVDNDELGQRNRRMQKGIIPVETPALTHKHEEDMVATEAQVNVLNQQYAEIFNKLKESKATNKDLQQKLNGCDERRARQDERFDELQNILDLLRETIGDLATEQENAEAEAESLRFELQAAHEEIEALRDGHGGDDKSLFDSGFVEADTPDESDELPRAKRVRRSTSAADDEFDSQTDEEDSDDLISPSSFLESEPSPLLIRDRRHGKTREQSRSLSCSPEADSKAQLKRDLAAAAPADPRGGVVVISRSETDRALRSAKANARKRKMCG